MGGFRLGARSALVKRDTADCSLSIGTGMTSGAAENGVDNATMLQAWQVGQDWHWGTSGLEGCPTLAWSKQSCAALATALSAVSRWECAFVGIA